MYSSVRDSAHVDPWPIFLTGYLGGAIAIQLPTGNPFFGEVLFPVYIAAFLWAGIYLRDERLRTMVPLRS